MTMLNHALRAQGAGFHIFPVTAGLKVPHPAAGYRDAAGLFHGWGETATNDLNQIIHFWTNVDPDANIGIACKPSQLLVVDLDRAKEDWNLKGTPWEYVHGAYGARVDGVDLFDEMMFKAGADSIRDIDTYTVQTGSGGIHLYYRWPAHFPQTSQASPVKGVVDVRGNGGQWGGYVLAAGSRTEAGEYRTLGTESPRLSPEWLREMVMPKPQQPVVGRPGGIRQPGAVSWAGLVDAVRGAGEGNRNNALLWAARAMCTDGAPESEAQQVLGEAAAAAGLGAFEIQRTIESAYRIQRQKEGS